MEGSWNCRRMSSISAMPIASWNGHAHTLPAACARRMRCYLTCAHVAPPERVLCGKAVTRTIQAYMILSVLASWMLTLLNSFAALPSAALPCKPDPADHSALLLHIVVLLFCFLMRTEKDSPGIAPCAGSR